MAIKGLRKDTYSSLSRFADGHFEEMLRNCHPFDENSKIVIKEINGVFISTDADKKIVAIGLFSGDPDEYDDTVYVYDGIITDYLSRDDNGNFSKFSRGMLEAHKDNFDEALSIAKSNVTRNRRPVIFRKNQNN